MCSKNESREFIDQKLREMNIGTNRTVTLLQRDTDRLRSCANAIVRQKELEEVHQYDCTRERQRWATGLIAEHAIEKFFGIRFSDTTAGRTEAYNYPDMEPAGYRLGIKASVYPNLPVVRRDSDYPELFVLLNENYTKAVILGVADVELLQANVADRENDHFIFSRRMLSRKTAFTRLDDLKPVYSVDDLNAYKIEA